MRGILFAYVIPPPLSPLPHPHTFTTPGSSTACIVVVNGSTLHACNLGDSGFMVLRDGAVAMRSAQQQHGFNFPFQVGCVDS